MNAVTLIRTALLIDAVGWALVLGQPGSTFALSPAYQGMASAGSENSWAALFIAFALSLVLTWRSRWQRATVVFVFGALHAWIALSLGRHSGWLSGGMVGQVVTLYLSWTLLGEDIRTAAHD